MPPQFQFPSREGELWVPVAFGPEEASGRGNNSYEVIARLRPDVTLEGARSASRTGPAPPVWLS